MSMITSADLVEEMVMGEVVVDSVTFGSVHGEDGEEGWVRSKPVREECNQKLDCVPIRALR